jgi:tight adherence protein C
MVMVVYVLQVFPFPEFLQPVLCFGATLLGFKGPEIYVRNTAIKRAQIITKALPDGLDLLTPARVQGTAGPVGRARL